ncbi:hypothetical protein TWF694_000441 [Orbilia ellipsospora]|uniref:Uncharacterized protein n=1 Tax=Orbilia ellipsospora TaxID=2528407 RepID=A0AAV9XP21_9PEZI
MFNLLDIRFLVLANFVSLVVALDCPNGLSNITAVRKTYPVPPITIYPLVGNFFNTSWSTIRSFNYSGTTHPPTAANGTQLSPPNATRMVDWDGYTFEEALIFINETAPADFFGLRWNLTDPPVSKKGNPLVIISYIQDFKFTASCDGEASLMEWTVEYCSNDQDAGWGLFQNTTFAQANNLAVDLDVPGASDGTWDVGCALPTTTSMSMGSSPTGGPGDSSTSTKTSTKSKNMAMATSMPVFGGALAAAAAAALAVL